MARTFLLSPSGDIPPAPVGIGREANPDLREPTFVSLLRIMMEQTAAETVPNRPSNREAEAADKGKEEKTRAGDRRKDDSRREPALFAATNLAFWETDKPHYYARDVGIDGTCFRRLDPEYYA